jgi:hypothetical protein
VSRNPDWRPCDAYVPLTLTYNQSFNPATTAGSQAWGAPLSVLTPRFVKIGAQIDF